ncbi:restriction endonuclease [uncultured Sphaerotilus sp.]|uniref:restriction endonuclease n=1 Tax=uncultured Sphaerotilus sp. TaxID=474984 RepID=UPI0030CA531E
MKLKMAEKSLFAVLLRSPWWISLCIAAVIGLVAAAALPPDFRVAGAVSGFPFFVISIMAAYRQRGQPSAAQVAQTLQTVSAMAWPAFARVLETVFQRDGYQVQRGAAPGVDFVLERQGRTTLVSARRWKAARIGLEPLRELQAAREAADAQEAICIALGEFTDNTRPFVREHKLTLWQAAEMAKALHGIPLNP